MNATIAHRLARGEVIVLFAGGHDGGRQPHPAVPLLAGRGRAGRARRPGVTEILLQPLAIAYVRRNGLPVTRRERPDIAWYGDMELSPHLKIFFDKGPLDAVVAWGEPIPFDGRPQAGDRGGRGGGQGGDPQRLVIGGPPQARRSL